jgi:hypothetical protein
MSTAREVRAVWAIAVLSAVAVVVTYSRVPAAELYHVSGGSLPGLSRVLVDLNFPDALLAVAMLGVLWPSLPRVAAAVAIVLCLVVVVPGVVSQANLDAKWINAVPALGVALALVLSLRARAPSERLVRGDRLRVALALVLAVLALPWLAAELGFYLRGPFLPVHHGVHHGLQGLFFVVTALLLSRIPNRISLFLALMLAYGLGNMLNDGWHEQIWERGWVSWSVPSTLEPALTWTWLGVLLATPVIWAAWFRQPSSSPRISAVCSPGAGGGAV